MKQEKKSRLVHIYALTNFVQRARLRREFQNSRGRRWTPLSTAWSKHIVSRRNFISNFGGIPSGTTITRTCVACFLRKQGEFTIDINVYKCDSTMRLPSRFSRNHEAGKLTSVIVDLAVEENWTSYVYCGDEGGKRQKFRDMGWQLYWGRTYHRGDSASRDTNEWPKMTRNITAYLPAADARFWRCICGKKTETSDFHPQRPPPCFTCLSIFHLSTCRSYGWRFRLHSTRLGWIRVSVTKYNETLDCSVDFSTWNVLVP